MRKAYKVFAKLNSTPGRVLPLSTQFLLKEMVHYPKRNDLTQEFILVLSK
jgi:hypothetical protein